MRKTIEHPEYLPGEVRKHTDFDGGKDQGRVWRLRGTNVPAHTKPNPRVASFAGSRPSALVDELNSPIPWRRDTAFRLVVESLPDFKIGQSNHEPGTGPPGLLSIQGRQGQREWPFGQFMGSGEASIVPC
jgi:hypothetical protein